VIAAMIAASATEVFGYRYKFAAQDLRDALRDLAAGYQGGEA
jgi:hypothetical protein